MIIIETNSDLDKAAEEFFQAAYKYRSAIKKYAPKELGGVIWVRRGTEMIAYSEMGKYTEQICTMTFDTSKDELVFTEPKRED